MALILLSDTRLTEHQPRNLNHILNVHSGLLEKICCGEPCKNVVNRESEKQINILLIFAMKVAEL
jgi:hypothetical protein